MSEFSNAIALAALGGEVVCSLCELIYLTELRAAHTEFKRDERALLKKMRE